MDELVLDELDGAVTGVDGAADPGVDSELIGVATDAEGEIAGGGVVPQPVSSSTAPKLPRARDEMAMDPTIRGGTVEVMAAGRRGEGDARVAQHGTIRRLIQRLVRAQVGCAA